MNKLMQWLQHGPVRRHWRRLVAGAVAAGALLLVVVLGWLWNWLAAVLIVGGFGCIALLSFGWWRGLRLQTLRRLAREFTARAGAADVAFTSWAKLAVDSTVRQAVESARAGGQAELLIGRIDDDGRVLGIFGPLPGLPAIRLEEFVERPRFGLDLVLIGDAVLVRKDYRGDVTTFLHEWMNLARLSGRVNAPAIHHVDEQGTLLYKNLVLGKTIREILVEAGAKILHAQTKDDPELARLDPGARIEAVWQRGRAVIPSRFSEEFLRDMERQVELAHSLGVLGVSHTYGNVVVDSERGAAWFIDLDKARLHRAPGAARFRIRRDEERRRFNLLYGRRLPSDDTGSDHAVGNP